MLSRNAVTHDVFFWERIGFRNAWVTAMQLPLAYILASRANLIGFLVGMSHERLNWLHRWVGRTMFVTATVHGFHFWVEWARADFLEVQLKAMPMVKYGLAAWGILLWTVMVGLYPIRHFSYELFVIQHVVSVVALLWVVHAHVPTEAQWMVWFSVATVAVDRAVRWIDLLRHNLHFIPTVSVTRPAPASLIPRVSVSLPGRGGCDGNRRLGHEAVVTPISNEVTLLTVKDVHFSWRAGQYLYLWVPRLGPFEAHPYTISCAHKVRGRCCCNSIQLVIRAHSGFSRRLHEFGRSMRQKNSRDADLTAFISGPYGHPPRVDIFETVILISASTGASFTLPILEGIVLGNSGCTRRVEYILLSRHEEAVSLYVNRVRNVAPNFHQRGVVLNVHVAVTGGEKRCPKPNTFASMQTSSSASFVLGSSPSLRRETGEGIINVEAAPGVVQSPRLGCCCTSETDNESGDDGASQLMPTEGVVQYNCRPDLEYLIRKPVEAARGETAVIVCGGNGLVSRVRNLVVSLSDERAVHKGSGAQGIAIFVEEYLF